VRGRSAGDHTNEIARSDGVGGGSANALASIFAFDPALGEFFKKRRGPIPAFDLFLKLFRSLTPGGIRLRILSK
jgi:hypothetical protein